MPKLTMDGTDIDCTFIRGASEGLKEELETWTRPGMDGHGAQQLGKRGGFRWTLTLHAAEVSEMEEWIESVENCQGKVIDLVDDWGTTHSGLIVQRVTQPDRRAHSLGARAEITIEGVVPGVTEEAG